MYKVIGAKSMKTESEIINELSVSSDLNDEFRKQPGLFAYWAFQQARAEDQVRKAEEQSDLMFSMLYAKYRDSNPGAKENDCKSFIRRSKRYKEIIARLNKAKHDRDILKAAVRAFEQRRDMLIQLGANLRSEFDSTDTGVKVETAKATRVMRRSLKKRGECNG